MRKEQRRNEDNMQISDLLGKYNRNLSNGTEELNSAQSTQKMVSTVGDLEAGSVFEGTVNQIKNGRVTLALGNGQTIVARLDGKVNIQVGNSMFFQVKSNDGTTIALRPYTGAGGSSGNPILLNALTAAQVPVTERNLSMVDAMMQEQMAIGKQNILDMAKMTNANPNLNVQTVVQLVKAGLPVTDVMAAQYESYISGDHAILGEMEQAAGQFVEMFGEEGLTPEENFQIYSSFVDTFVSEAQTEAAQNLNQTADGVVLTVSQQAGQAFAEAQTAVAGQPAVGVTQTQAGQTFAETQATVAGQAAEGTSQAFTEMQAAVAGQAAEGTSQAFTETQAAVVGQTAEGTPQTQAGQEQSGIAGQTLAQIFDETQLGNLTRQLQQLPAFAENSELFLTGSQEEVYVDTLSEDISGGTTGVQTNAASENPAKETAALNQNMTAAEFLTTIRKVLTENRQYGYTGVGRLLAGKEMQTLMKNVIEQQWLIKPQDLKEENKISALYEKMERQLQQMENAVKMTGTEQNTFLQTASDVHGNIEFMNQVNQLYHYVQIPLQMSGQNANGELYVYTNARKRMEQDAELTAFLHLDMEHLGSTDVSVRMKDKQVKTNFYLPDDSSYKLVEQHLPILEKHLNQKGYTCSITMSKDKDTAASMEHLIQQDRPVGGTLHRYSFDVRA
jgi:flagellar hook-length control protein FliK